MRWKKKMFKEGEKNRKRRKWWRCCNNREKQRNKRWKNTKVATKMKQKMIRWKTYNTNKREEK
jgi:hypothetical protein